MTFFLCLEATRDLLDQEESEGFLAQLDSDAAHADAGNLFPGSGLPLVRLGRSSDQRRPLSRQGLPPPRPIDALLCSTRDRAFLARPETLPWPKMPQIPSIKRFWRRSRSTYSFATKRTNA